MVIIWLMILNNMVYQWLLVGGWPTPLKNMTSSVRIEIPNWMESHNPFMFQTTNQIIMIIVILRPNTLICPRLSAAIFWCAENVVKMGVFCITGNLKWYISTHRSLTCAWLLHSINIIIIIIKPLLKIFNECRSFTGVGELNPYWRSSMNVEV